MTTKRAVSILILSPVYFRMTLNARLALVQEFCAAFSTEQPIAPCC